MNKSSQVIVDFMGCKTMKYDGGSGNTKPIIIRIFHILILLLIFTIIIQINSAAPTYIPATPTGPSFGYINITYEYSIFTTNPNSLWMFDWGDETYTQWHSLNNSVGILTETHQWTTPGTYSICVQYRNEFFDEGIWSEPLIVTITDCTIDDLPQIPEPPQGITRGCTNQPYTFSTQTTDPSGILIQYRIKWNIHTISNWTSYTPSGTPRELTHIWQKPGEYTLYSQARNQYGLISNWSTPVSLTIQLDTDEDHVPDTIENQYGSNYSDPTDITLIQLNNHEHFLILTEITPYFYNTTQQNASMIRTLEPGKLLLDDNLDGKWDYLYNKLKGTLTTYNPLPINTEFILLTLVILASITTIILILVILIKKGYIYLYEEYVTDE